VWYYALFVAVNTYDQLLNALLDVIAEVVGRKLVGSSPLEVEEIAGKDGNTPT